METWPNSNRCPLGGLRLPSPKSPSFSWVPLTYKAPCALLGPDSLDMCGRLTCVAFVQVRPLSPGYAQSSGVTLLSANPGAHHANLTESHIRVQGWSKPQPPGSHLGGTVRFSQESGRGLASGGEQGHGTQPAWGPTLTLL